MLVKQEMGSLINDNMMAYSAEVLLQRAIPTLQDGFKPVNRRILFTLYNDNITRLTKSMTVTGRVAAIHPHGSSYGAMVGMAQSDRHQVPLVDGHGNFGQFSSSEIEAAAERYTEVKISDFGKLMTNQIKDKVINMVPNYDGRIMVPEVIPVSFPTILTYAQSGIGVGYASSTLSYNMLEIIEAIKGYIRDEDTPILYPDFVTGGYIVKDLDALESNTISGKATFTLRGKVEKVNSSTLSITEIPWGVKREAIIDKIVQLYKTGKMNEIRNVQDLTDFHGLNIEITTKKTGVDLDVLIEKLYKMTALQSTVSSNANVIDIERGLPELLGVEEIISRWVKWRVKIYIKSINNQIADLSKKVMLYSGLRRVLLNTDELVEIIRKTKKDVLIATLNEKFELNDEQSQFIINMKLYNINNDYISEKIAEIEQMERQLTEKRELVGNESKIKELIITELEEIGNKFGTARQTEIIDKPVANKKVIAKINEHLTEYSNIIITKDGYVFRDVNESRITLKPGDEIIKIVEDIDTSSKLQVISTDGNMYGVEVGKIASGVLKVGTYALSIPKNSSGSTLLILHERESDKEIIYGYSNGRLNTWPASSINFDKTITRNAFAKNEDIIFAEVNIGKDIIATNKGVDKTLKNKDLSRSNSRASKGTYSIPNAREGVTFRKA